MIHQNEFVTASLIVKLGNAVTYYRNIKMEDLGLTSIQSDALIAALHKPEITASQLKSGVVYHHLNSLCSSECVGISNKVPLSHRLTV